ncbi:MAG: FAD-dependent oxidoreductase [Candidatus Sumerlaeia bacterium]|nr:FAD-dependent oxidoreductase [Candidatus Sumerlaeia bacterium]
MGGRHVVILGSGVCGLAAAHRLLELDPARSVTLLEAEDRPGGLARSLTLDGHVMDMGPHRIYTELPDVQEFLQNLAGPDLVEVPRVSRMWLGGRWIEYPPKPVEATMALGLGSVLKAGASFAWQKTGGRFADEQHRHESFQSIMSDAFGPELYRLLVGPYAEKVWKVPGTEIHADIGRVRVSAGGLDRMIRRLLRPEQPGQETALKKFFYIEGGVETLVRKLLDRIGSQRADIKCGCQARSLAQRGGSGWTVGTTLGDFEADQVISTIPMPDLVGMLKPAFPDANADRAACELRYIANFLVVLIVNKKSLTDAQWLYFPGPDTIFNRGYLPKNFHSSMGGAEQTALVLEITCHRDDPVWRMTDRQLIDQSVADLTKIGMLNSADVAASMVHRIPNTYPLYDLGYRDRMQVLIEYLGKVPGLISTGRQGLYLHNNMDHSIHMGFRAADFAAQGSPTPGLGVYAELSKYQHFRIVD